MYHSSTTKRSFSGPACRNKNVAIVFVCLATSGYGAKPEQIPLQQNKVCQIIFPDKIAKIRGGFNPNYFALDKYDNILYIQCLTDFPNTNLSIITDDTSCSTCVIRKRARRMPTSSTLPIGSTSTSRSHWSQGRSLRPLCVHNQQKIKRRLKPQCYQKRENMNQF